MVFEHSTGALTQFVADIDMILAMDGWPTPSGCHLVEILHFPYQMNTQEGSSPPAANPSPLPSACQPSPQPAASPHPTPTQVPGPIQPQLPALTPYPPTPAVGPPPRRLRPPPAPAPWPASGVGDLPVYTMSLKRTKKQAFEFLQKTNEMTLQNRSPKNKCL